ncbi:hypothetical protein [uncultured Bacteroides sp.]|uniref:hypothetical protein n=1 Tax=uncultured Bacteroides sp. TaxID=162156 RepID=UPI002616AB0F|nr:hypothetical protein [uncultured Bacteroides sp.]
MKLALSLIAGTAIVAVIFCLWLNWATEQEEQEHEKKQQEIIKTLMPNWSLRNAMIINRETCVCPENIKFINGIMHRTPDENDRQT